MANNYTPNYNQYLTQTAGYALPSSVRSYSVFDPSSNSWRRMTNDGRSPMPMTPAQEQAAVAGALMQAQQTQGKVWNPLPAPVQGMTQTQTPGILLRPRQQSQPQPTQVTRPLPRRTARQNAQPNITPVVTQQPTERPVQLTEVPEDVSLWGNQGKLQEGTPVVIDLPKDPNFGTGVAVHQPLLSVPVATPTTDTQVALARHYGQKTTPNLPGLINTKPNRVVTLGEHMAKLGNGFLGLLGLNRPTNLDPDLSNHSDPRW